MVSRHWSDRAYWFALFLASPPSRDMRKGGRSMMDTLAYARSGTCYEEGIKEILSVSQIMQRLISETEETYFFCLEIQRNR